MKISVIVPIYNVEEYLEECLDSVVAQTFSDWEMILVDDGSTDGRGEIADAYAEQYDNVKVIHKENGGLSDARNTGLSIAKGEYVYFLDSDDYIKRETLEVAYETAERSQVDLVVFNGIDFFTDTQGKKHERREHITNFKNFNRTLSGKDVFNETVAGDGGLLFCVWLQLVRRDLLNKINLKFEKGMLHEDNLYSFYLFMGAESVVVIRQQMYMRRIREGSIMNTKISIRNLRGYEIIYKKVTAWMRDNEVEYILRQNINCYLRLFFMEIAKNYYDLSKEEKSDFKDSYYNIIKTAASNNYNNDKYVRLICRHKIAYGIYQYMKRIINR